MLLLLTSELFTDLGKSRYKQIVFNGIHLVHLAI